MSNLQTVCRLEQDRFDAMVGGRVDDIEAMLDEQLIYIHSSGVVDSKASYVEGQRRSAYVYHGIELAGRQSVESDDEVILTQTLTVTMTIAATQATVSKSMVATSIWRRRGADWKLILLQSTPL